MEVRIENEVGPCPAPCPHADIDVRGEVLSRIDGAALVYVSACCSHAEVCEVRKAAARADD